MNVEEGKQSEEGNHSETRNIHGTSRTVLEMWIWSHGPNILHFPRAGFAHYNEWGSKSETMEGEVKFCDLAQIVTGFDLKRTSGI